MGCGHCQASGHRAGARRSRQQTYHDPASHMLRRCRIAFGRGIASLPGSTDKTEEGSRDEVYPKRYTGPSERKEGRAVVFGARPDVLGRVFVKFNDTPAASRRSQGHRELDFEDQSGRTLRKMGTRAVGECRGAVAGFSLLGSVTVLRSARAALLDPDPRWDLPN